MFSGGLLSRNLGRSFGKRHSKHQSKKNPKQHPTAKNTTKTNLREEDLINWCEDIDQKQKHKANLRPSYTVEVKGSFHLLSLAGYVALLGIGILIIGSLFAGIGNTKDIGPVLIGTGLYVILMGICWLFDDRDNSRKLYHIHDLYTQHAVKKFMERRKLEDSSQDKSTSCLKSSRKNDSTLVQASVGKRTSSSASDVSTLSRRINTKSDTGGITNS